MKILYDTQASAVASTVLRSLLAHKDEAATTPVKMIFCDRSGVNLKRFSMEKACRRPNAIMPPPILHQVMCQRICPELHVKRMPTVRCRKLSLSVPLPTMEMMLFLVARAKRKGSWETLDRRFVSHIISAEVERRTRGTTGA